MSFEKRTILNVLHQIWKWRERCEISDHRSVSAVVVVCRVQTIYRTLNLNNSLNPEHETILLETVYLLFVSTFFFSFFSFAFVFVCTTHTIFEMFHFTVCRGCRCNVSESVEFNLNVWVSLTNFCSTLFLFCLLSFSQWFPYDSLLFIRISFTVVASWILRPIQYEPTKCSVCAIWAVFHFSSCHCCVSGLVFFISFSFH